MGALILILAENAEIEEALRVGGDSRSQARLYPRVAQTDQTDSLGLTDHIWKTSLRNYTSQRSSVFETTDMASSEVSLASTWCHCDRQLSIWGPTSCRLLGRKTLGRPFHGRRRPHHGEVQRVHRLWPADVGCWHPGEQGICEGTGKSATGLRRGDGADPTGTGSGEHTN